MIIISALAGLALLQGGKSAIPDAYFEINTVYARSCSRAAIASRQGGEVGDGQADCTRALQTEPLNRLGMAQTLTNRGVIRLAAQNRAGALADFNAAIETAPDQAPAYINRAGLYMGSHDFDRALADAEKAVQLDSANARAMFMRGGANEMLGHTREAYRDYQAAAKLDPAWDQPKTELARFKVAK